MPASRVGVCQSGAGKCDHRLEMAILYYIRNFRKAFITDGRGVPSLSLSDITTSGKDKVRIATDCCFLALPVPCVVVESYQMFQAMFERMGMGDLPVLISLIVQKLSNNLRFWYSNREVTALTLELFADLSSFNCGRLLISLEAVNYVLNHHTVRLWKRRVAGHRAC
jgi:hypothetical protein